MLLDIAENPAAERRKQPFGFYPFAHYTLYLYLGPAPGEIEARVLVPPSELCMPASGFGRLKPYGGGRRVSGFLVRPA
jgi:hypothetical protein